MYPVLRWVAPIAFAMASLVISAHSVAAVPTMQTLHTFCSKANCGDGSGPWWTPLRDAGGNLLGATRFGGAGGRGSVYELVKKGDGYKFKTLYSFCTLEQCTDGDTPVGTVIQDIDGILYGMTTQGGTNNAGVVYRLKPNTKQTQWAYKVLYNFCSKANCTDGSQPRGALTYVGAQSGAPYDGVSPLFGTTAAGGNSSNFGVAFQLTRGAKRTAEKTIHVFCSVGETCDDGAQPMGTLLPDANGNLYGTLNVGAALNANGAIFKLSPHGQKFSETLLYNFCALANCADGSSPREVLSFDGAGSILGATWRGGTHDGNDSGVVFKLVQNGGSYQLSLLYDFCALSGCADGEWPNGGLSVASNGDIVGTTDTGGTNGHGTIFKLHSGAETVLFRFCDHGGECTDGERPGSGPVSDQSGDLFGATALGGTQDDGVIYELAP